MYWKRNLTEASETIDPSQPSLRARLLRDVMLPLVLTWALGTAVAVSLAVYFTEEAFDRSLLDDALLVAANVRTTGDTIELTFSPRELRAALFDQSETVLHALRYADGRMVTGNPGLAAEMTDVDHPVRISDLRYRGRVLRAVTLRREGPVPFEVVVAHTTQSRQALILRLLAYSVLPQLALLGLLAWWLRRAIDVDLKPLSDLHHTLERKDANDLSAVPVHASTSDVAQLGAALNSLLSRLEQSVRAQKEFSGNVAHELRTPLAGIRALATYGLAQQDPARWREQLQRIVQSESRASHLVDQLLALALADEARAAVQLVPLRLDEAVRDTVLRFLARADAAGVDLGAIGLDDPVWVLGDAILLEGVLNNLLDNALRYGRPDAGVPPVITVEIARQGGQTALSVLDNGPGLPPAAVQRLLRRWAQGESGVALRQGAGLGLAIVTQYARVLRASLSLEAGPQGRGLCARLTFAHCPTPAGADSAPL